MAKTRDASGALRVALTGASSDLGRLLLPRLLADPRVARVLVLDTARPREERLEFHRVDLTRHDADAELVRALSGEPVDALYHLAFKMSPTGHGALAHELEVPGTMGVLAAASEARVARFILPSQTALYGARRQAPALLTEDSPLEGCPGSRFITDKLEVERQVRVFAERHPSTRVLVLRMAPVVGPHQDNPVTRLLALAVVPTLMGFDPLWQALHEEDAARALHLALVVDAVGAFNVVGRGVLPLSGLIRAARRVPLPLPAAVATSALRALNMVGAAGVPVPLLDYLRFSWVADGGRAEAALGFTPEFHTRDAVASLR
ncbi:MAG: NAD-dependent epimerase/dehydratase family protein, partial [Myxococcaceae bacterium]|nr:NAD-dependent epimerase/dehydratase family protein [Myxococcaceae bacterium]